MSEPRGRVILGFLLAPLAAPTVFLLLTLAENRLYGMPPGSSLFGEVLVALFVVMLPTYLTTILLGIPTYCLLKRYACVRLWHALVIAAAAGCVFLPVTSELSRGLLFVESPALACALVLWWFVREAPGARAAPTADGERLTAATG
jgi:hypothetical protein